MKSYIVKYDTKIISLDYQTRTKGDSEGKNYTITNNSYTSIVKKPIPGELERRIMMDLETILFNEVTEDTATISFGVLIKEKNFFKTKETPVEEKFPTIITKYNEEELDEIKKIYNRYLKN